MNRYESLAEEIGDLRRYIDGLSSDLREGPYGQVYEARVDALQAELDIGNFVLGED